MLSNLRLTFISLLFMHYMHVAAAQSCLGTIIQLLTLLKERGNNVSTPATYIMCPNTTYYPKDGELFFLNGNAQYLCGASGSSANNCIVTGGFVQVLVIDGSYNQANKDSILMSGFTFTQSGTISGAIAAKGKFTFRDCIFRVRLENSMNGWILLLKCDSTYLSSLDVIFFATGSQQ
jgi:hypothetical protein